jgi:hypothetical protein
MSTPSARILHLGLDVHKESVISAVLADTAPTPQQIDTLPHDLGRLKRYFDRLARDGAQLRCVYEASGAGYVLQRAIESWGYHCDICAPSLTPRRPGHQRKHNRYDAKELAHFYRGGDLVLIAIPTEAEERTRDLVRCRTTFQRQLHRARQFVLKFCTRRGLRYAPAGMKKSHWTRAHRAWLAARRTDPALGAEDRTVLAEYLALVEYAEHRRDALDRQLDTLVLAPALAAAGVTPGPHWCWGARCGTGAGSRRRRRRWPTWGSSLASTRARPSTAGRSRRPGTVTVATCWSRRRGPTGTRRGSGAAWRRGRRE